MDTPEIGKFDGPTRIGNYTILSMLGSGVTGRVYQGREERIGGIVAIRILAADIPEKRMRHFEAQAKMLRHPEIVIVYDIGEYGGKPYIVMEYVAGESLQKVLLSGRQLTLLEILQIILHVCSILAYALRKGVTHGFIKPSSILVAPDGSIKVKDFGIRELATYTLLENDTKEGDAMWAALRGPIVYMAPEAIKGFDRDSRSDIWSTGVLLYRLVTGRFPFTGNEEFVGYKVLLKEPFEPPGNRVKPYPPALNRIFERTLASDPRDRFTKAEDLYLELIQVFEDVKRVHAIEGLAGARQLLEMEKLTSAKAVLTDLLRVHPKHNEMRTLLSEVQKKLFEQQRLARVRQWAWEAEGALLHKNYDKAIELYAAASELNPNDSELIDQLNQARELKEKADSVFSLLQQGIDARQRGDFKSAEKMIGQALIIDEHDLELRGEWARIKREPERLELSRAGRQMLLSWDFQGAIESLRNALEIDPKDTEIQELLKEAVAKREEQERRTRREPEGYSLQHGKSHSTDASEALAQLQQTPEVNPAEPPFEACSKAEPFIFVSYSHADAGLVYPAIQLIHQMGFRIWYDEGIDPGNEWPEEVAEALDRSSFFLVFISPQSVISENVRKEIDFAISHKKPLVAVHLVETLLPRGLELRMGNIQAIMRWKMKSDRYIRQMEKTLPQSLRA